MLEHHPLMKEFPEYKERMHELKLKNRHFDSLIEKYEALDKNVFRVESEEEVLDEETQKISATKIREQMRDDGEL